MKKVIYFALSVGTFLITVAFSCTPPPPPPNGFNIKTQFQEIINGIPGPEVGQSRAFNAEFLTGNPTTGTLSRCFGQTDSSGHFPCPDRRVPAVWAFTFADVLRPCSGQTNFHDVTPGGTIVITCQRFITQFFVSPDAIDMTSPPATMDISGGGMDTTYGMPQVAILTAGGQLLGQSTATACNGSWLQTPTPYLGFVGSGQYLLEVGNIGADGNILPIGGAWIWVFGNEPPPPPPPMPCYGSGGPCEEYPPVY